MEDNNEKEDEFFDEETVLDDYELIGNDGKLGTGSYGAVSEYKIKKTGKRVAIKQMEISMDKEGIPTNALREVTLLRNLHHENILTLYDVIFTDKYLYLVYELLDEDLDNYINELNNIENKLDISPFNYNTLIKHFLRQIIIGVDYCHLKNVTHRDIKPSNILVNKESKIIKIGDFGLARMKPPGNRPLTLGVMSPWYRAPELFLGSDIYNESIDMWSIGCVFGFMASGQHLFKEKEDIEIVKKIYQLLGTPNMDINNPFPQYENLPNHFKFDDNYYPKDFREVFPNLEENGIDLLKKLLLYDSTKRITCKEALQHPYFKN